MPFCTDPGTPYIPLKFTLGLADVEDWRAQVGDPPWILDPAEYPKLDCGTSFFSSFSSFFSSWICLWSPGQQNLGRGSTDEFKKERKRKNCWKKKSELKVTTRGIGKDTPIWSQRRDSSLDSTSSPDSGLSSDQKNRDADARSIPHTPRFSPNRGWRQVYLTMIPQ